MLIDFSKIDLLERKNFPGGKQALLARMFEDEHNRIFHGTLPPGASLGMHVHADSCEVFYILSGTGHVLCDDGVEALSPGLCHYCPKGHSHSLVNDGSEPLCFFAIVAQQ